MKVAPVSLLYSHDCGLDVDRGKMRILDLQSMFMLYLCASVHVSPFLTREEQLQEDAGTEAAHRAVTLNYKSLMRQPAPCWPTVTYLKMLRKSMHLLVSTWQLVLPSYALALADHQVRQHVEAWCLFAMLLHYCADMIPAIVSSDLVYVVHHCIGIGLVSLRWSLQTDPMITFITLGTLLCESGLGVVPSFLSFCNIVAPGTLSRNKSMIHWTKKTQFPFRICWYIFACYNVPKGAPLFILQSAWRRYELR